MVMKISFKNKHVFVHKNYIFLLLNNSFIKGPGCLNLYNTNKSLFQCANEKTPSFSTILLGQCKVIPKSDLSKAESRSYLPRRELFLFT